MKKYISGGEKQQEKRPPGSSCYSIAYSHTHSRYSMNIHSLVNLKPTACSSQCPLANDSTHSVLSSNGHEKNLPRLEGCQ